MDAEKRKITSAGKAARGARIVPLHERLLDYVAPVRVQLEVLRLTAHTSTLEADVRSLDRAAAEYDAARRHLDRFERSLARAERARRAA